MENEREQAAFERWIENGPQSGDAEEVLRQWLDSYAREDLFTHHSQAAQRAIASEVLHAAAEMRRLIGFSYALAERLALKRASEPEREKPGTTPTPKP